MFAYLSIGKFCPIIKLFESILFIEILALFFLGFNFLWGDEFCIFVIKLES